MLERWTGRPEDLAAEGAASPDPFGRWRKILTGLFLVVGVVGLGYWLIRQPAARPIVIPVADSSNSSMVRVHVTGAVLRSGVYEVPEGQRVGDAIVAAGGALETADLTRINMAARIRDQQQIVIPIRGASPAISGTVVAGAQSSRIPAANSSRIPALASGESTTRTPVRGSATPFELISVNRATVSDLAKLPGISSLTAERIVRHRDQFGSFAAIDDLRTLNLVTRANWEKARPHLTM